MRFVGFGLVGAGVQRHNDSCRYATDDDDVDQIQKYDSGSTHLVSPLILLIINYFLYFGNKIVRSLCFYTK